LPPCLFGHSQSSEQWWNKRENDSQNSRRYAEKMFDIKCGDFERLCPTLSPFAKSGDRIFHVATDRCSETNIQGLIKRIFLTFWQKLQQHNCGETAQRIWLDTTDLEIILSVDDYVWSLLMWVSFFEAIGTAKKICLTLKSRMRIDFVSVASTCFFYRIRK
jgi:hypothetical protein